MGKIRGIEMKCERGETRVETKRNRCLCREKASRVLFNVSIFISRSLFRVEKALPSSRNDGEEKFSLWRNKIYVREESACYCNNNYIRVLQIGVIGNFVST